MSWFKDRKDNGTTKANTLGDDVKTSSSGALSPAARSFDDARRALRASINLENDQQDAPNLNSAPEIAKSPIAESISSRDADVEAKTIAPSPIVQSDQKLAVSEEKKASDLIEETKEEFPNLIDPMRAKDIQSILSKIGQINATPETVTEDTEADTPPPPAFHVRPNDQKDIQPIEKPSIEAIEASELKDTVVETQAPQKPSPAIPPMGKMSDPTLGKATSIPASLSNAIKDAAPQVEESAIPEFLHESISNTIAKSTEQESNQPKIITDKIKTDIEDLSRDLHIEDMIKNSAVVPNDLPVSPAEKAVDNSSKLVDHKQDEKRVEETVTYEAPKQRARMISDAPGLEIHNLGKTYKKTPVLKDVSLNVKRGEAVGLLGPNGAGKTTCFYMVCGLIPADFGSISLDGQDITELPMYRRARMGIGYLPQEASIFRGLTVEQNVRAVLEGVEKNRDKREAMLESLLDEFSISHLRRSAAVSLSGGERRRLEIARALASQPHFILLDEPLAGIDPIAVRDIRELVSHLKDRGLGVLITDHNVRETLGIVDRAYILHEGRVLMEGVPDDIIRNQEVRRVYLGDEFSR